MLFKGLGEGVAVGVDFDQLTGANHAFEQVSEDAAVVTADGEFANELLVASVVLGLALDVLKDFCVGNHVSVSEW